MKSRRTSISLIAILILTIALTGSKCDGKPDEYKTENNEEIVQSIKEAASLNYSSNMTDDEKGELLKEIEDMSAEEFNQIIDEELENLPDEESTEFLNWLKNNYLVYDGCSNSNWRLPTDFKIPENMQWSEAIPKPSQGSVAKVEQSEDITRVQIKNITKKTYEQWKSKFDDKWSFGCAVLEAVNKKLDKAEEYVENNTKYNLGETSETTKEIYENEGREKNESVIFTDEHMSKWLELSYGHNMATIAYTNNFTVSATDNKNSEKTDTQKINEAMLNKVCALNIPAPKEEKLTKYTPEGKTENGNIGQVLQFEGGDVESTDEWEQKLFADGWDIKTGDIENFVETKMHDIDGTDDFMPDTQGFTAKTTDTYFEKQVDNTVYRMQVTTVETSYGLEDEIDTESGNYRRWVIVTINGIDVLDLASAEK